MRHSPKDQVYEKILLAHEKFRNGHISVKELVWKLRQISN